MNRQSRQNHAKRSGATSGMISLAVFCSFTLTGGFQIPLPRSLGTTFRNQPIISHTRTINHRLSDTNFVDVEFERSESKDLLRNSTTVTSVKPQEKIKEKSSTKKKKSNDDTGTIGSSSSSSDGKSLFELSLDTDPQWKGVRIPFVDTQKSTVIDGTLAFCVELEGNTYGIAVPCDSVAAITVEDLDGSVKNMYPDDDENEEIMEIMATQLTEQIGEDLFLKRTPRVLTIEGNLDKVTKNWDKELLPKPHSVEDLMDESDEDLKFFQDFMKAELGEEEYEKTMAEPVTAEDIGDELMELFEIPGMGTRQDDVAGVEAMMKSLFDGEDPSDVMEKELGGDFLKHEGAALKLISYNFKNGKTYSLVQLLNPYTLVGRLNTDEKDSVQFDLLSPEEEKIIIPRLEEVCRKDLEESGLSLSP